MQDFFTADQHHFHDAIIRYCQRPFENAQVMSDIIIKNHNTRIKAEDTVYINGDYGFFRKKEDYDRVTDQLNGNLIFVKGNHDRISNKIKNKLIRCVLQSKDLFLNIVHDPAYADPNYFINVVGHVHLSWDQISFRDYYNKVKTTLFASKDERYRSKLLWFIKKWKATNLSKSLLINVGVDVRNFYPISLEEIIDIYFQWKKR